MALPTGTGTKKKLVSSLQRQQESREPSQASVTKRRLGTSQCNDGCLDATRSHRFRRFISRQSLANVGMSDTTQQRHVQACGHRAR